MRKRIDIYAFFYNLIIQIYNIPTVTYEYYCNFPTTPVSKELFDLVENEVFIHRYLLFYVWMAEYCLKNNLRVDFGYLNQISASAVVDIFKQKFQPQGYSIERIKELALDICLKMDERHFAFWNTDIFTNAKEKKEEFLNFYCKYMIVKYGVNPSDIHTVCEISRLFSFILSDIGLTMSWYEKEYKLILKKR